jgi:hypothetical protein
MQYPVFPATFGEEAVFSSLYVFDTFVENHMGIVAWIHIWVFYSVPLVFMSVFMPVPCYFYCYGSVVQFEVGYSDTSKLFFLFSIALAICGLLYF